MINGSSTTATSSVGWAEPVNDSVVRRCNVVDETRRLTSIYPRFSDDKKFNSVLLNEDLDGGGVIDD